MKTKPTRHKKANTFQFKPFSERISEIDIDIFHRVAHRNEESDEGTETYFYQTVQKWNVLNLTQGYCDFKKKVRNIVTLPQLLNEKQLVIDTLIEYLNQKDVLYLQPILELVVAVARDLQKEFYEYFPQFLNIIIDLLQTKDTDQLEYAFTTLAYLFKFLWRYLVKNVPTVLDLLLPLLADTQPTYVNNFAAESFAFVVRKIKDKDGFLKVVLKILEAKPNSVSGCGKLLFEVISGTPGQFHSCAEQMLLLYFRGLQNESINQTLLYDVLKQITSSILQNIHPQKCSVLWSVLITVIDESVNKEKDCTLIRGKEKSLLLILRLLCTFINHKSGRLLLEPVPLIKKLLQIIDIFQGDTETLSEVITVAVAILLANNVKLMQEHSSILLFKIMSIPSTELLYTTTESLIHYSSFETVVLPYLLRHIASVGFDTTALRLLSKICKEKAPPCLSGINLNKWKKFVLDVNNLKLHSNKDCLELLRRLTDVKISSDVLALLLILPHLKPLPEEFMNILKTGLTVLYKTLKHSSDKSNNEVGRINFTFLLLSEAMVHIFEPEVLHEIFTTENICLFSLLRQHNNDIAILNAIDLLLTFFSASALSTVYVNQEKFDDMNTSVALQLSSPIDQVRLTVTHMYSLFANVDGLKQPPEINGNSAVELIFMADREPVTVQTYQERLLHLENLSFRSSAVMNLETKYYDFPLRYLLGNLYINFSLLWEPLIKIIASYASKECPQFWPIFLSELTSNNVTDAAYKPLYEHNIISELEAQIRKDDNRPDNENFKLLLWKCMSHFVSYCEVKNRDITGLFIDHVNNNFYQCNSEDAKFCSIVKHKQTTESTVNMEGDSDSDSEENIKDFTEAKPSAINEPGRNNRIKILLAQMEVFAKIANPRSLYREPEMQKIYLDLLTSKNSDIQKIALDCLFTYKYEYLLPYKDQLYGLLNEKNLKNELARFKIDEESNMIQEKHRDGLMPILMRIIYAKMVTKTGMRTGGKAGGLVKRKVILRFLTGAHEKEMMVFVQMAFRPFRKYITFSETEKVNLKAMINSIVQTVDLTKVVPPKRMQSAVNLLGIIIEQFGAKMEHKLLPHLLAMLLCILAEVTGILKRLDEVHTGYLTSIKNIRTSCINILARFFAHFENYNWSEHEIDALCTLAIFPLLEKLPIEGIHSPTALLKLFMTWSQNPRYFPLFIKHHEDNPLLSPLPFIIQLLLAPKTHPSVINAILEMLEKMLTLHDYAKLIGEMDIDEPYVPLQPILTNLLPIEQNFLSNGVNYGSIILLPHVSSILEYMKRKLKTTRKGVNKTELIILSRISEFVTDAGICDTLISLLVPILIKRATIGEHEENINELISTIINLIKNVKSPEIHLRIITPLFGIISAVPARKLLMQLYAIIAEKAADEHRATMLANNNLLSDLNAWDQKWIDQPDFQKRLDTFNKINKLAENNEISLEFGVIVIYNCFYFLRNENDLAMRDCSGQCLKVVGSNLAREHTANPVDRRYLMDDTILAIIRKNINSNNDVVRLQSIAFLGHMALECPEVHSVLRDLSLLANKADPEVDFFENMQHLQMHRRARALLKFCTVAKTLKKPMQPKTLTQFILPLASMYLCNESYIHKNSTIDAAIETVGTVCRLLPWYHYEIILRHYLGKLRSADFQKQVVRLIVAILDAFHYDLSKYKSLDNIQEKETVANSDNKITSSVSVSVGEEKDESIVDGEEDEDPKQEEEKLDEALNNEDATGIDEIEEKAEEAIKEEDIPIMQKQIILSQNGARRIVQSISKGLLPQLHRSITARTRHDSSHKINRRKMSAENEEDDLVRVPIALALVKLLQKLPEGILDANLPGILMKLCTFLKSRLDSVRRATREILQKIMITLGPKYLHHLLKEMNSLLTKGFQIHVLVYTVHAVLVVLKPYFQKIDINNNLQSILSVCRVDLFGLTAEEKEVAGITKNVTEAKSTKSFDIFHILAEFITESCLLDLILPLRDVLLKTHSHKTVYKVVECLRNVVLGLADNKFIQLDKMLIFLYGIVSESIPELMPVKKEPQNEKELDRSKPDCFIIPPEPKSRTGVKVAAKTSRNTNAHVMIEFGLKLFHILLKREKITAVEFKSFLEPFVPILSDCLKSQHVKLSTSALQCLNWIIKMDLASVHSSASDICSSMFGILHKYAAAGLSKGDNFDLVMAAFKCMSVLVRDVKHFTIDTDQLKALILYAEQDLHDSDKQATAFGVLKAIISRKLVVNELHTVMEKIAQLSITSELEHVRLRSRSVFYSYLMQYPLGKHLNKHISFYLSQLGYETQPGRLSALEMIHSVITGFPLKTLTDQSGLIFIMTSARLVNDDDPICRKLCAKCIKEMIVRLPHNERNKLFDIVIQWLRDTKVIHRRLAAQLCGVFVSIEKEGFESHLEEVLPLLLKQFYASIENDDETQPGRFVKLRKDGDRTEKLQYTNIKDPERLKDHHLFQVLQLLLKIAAYCGAFLKDNKYKGSVRLFAEYSQSLLAHPHMWVRLAAAQFIGFILAALDVNKIARLWDRPEECEEDGGYIYTDPVNTVKSLVLDLVGQLQPDLEFEELADQVIKNLIFIARIIKPVKKHNVEACNKSEENEIKEADSLSLPWLVRRLRKAVNIEITQAPKSTSVRTAMFKWIAGIVSTISVENLNAILFNIMSPLVREMSTTDESNAPLRQLAKEAAKMIKKLIGNEEYIRLLNQVQQKHDVKKAQRRKIRTQQFVTDPELAAKRKIARQQKKKEARKRKLDNVRGKKVFKKRPKKDIDLDVF